MSNQSTSPIRKSITGTVVSDKQDKTIVVEWERRVKHPLYKKYISEHSKVKAHDESEIAKEGDLVKIVFCRPISKDKSWRLDSVLEK